MSACEMIAYAALGVCWGVAVFEIWQFRNRDALRRRVKDRIDTWA